MSKQEIKLEIAEVKLKLLNGNLTATQRAELTIVLIELYKSAIHSVDPSFLN
jgi:hypothetical protein